jgi:hypothetical protein
VSLPFTLARRYYAWTLADGERWELHLRGVKLDWIIHQGAGFLCVPRNPTFGPAVAFYRAHSYIRRTHTRSPFRWWWFSLDLISHTSVPREKFSSAQAEFKRQVTESFVTGSRIEWRYLGAYLKPLVRFPQKRLSLILTHLFCIFNFHIFTA